MSKTKYPRADALAVAREMCQALKPVTDKLIVAGSLRRMKPEVGDVEIVFIPLMGEKEDPGDLLGHKIPCNLAADVINDMVARGLLTKRPKVDGTMTWGEQIKLAVHAGSGIPIDFFQGNRSNWWTLLVCRTGSKENNEAICNAAIARGMRWNPYHGFEDRLTGAMLWIPQSEQDLYRRVGLPYKEPHER